MSYRKKKLLFCPLRIIQSLILWFFFHIDWQSKGLMAGCMISDTPIGKNCKLKRFAGCKAWRWVFFSIHRSKKIVETQNLQAGVWNWTSPKKCKWPSRPRCKKVSETFSKLCVMLPSHFHNQSWVRVFEILNSEIICF